MKLCVLFPGIGYHRDKPLLYYTAKLAKRKGYDIAALEYSGLPEGAKGSGEKMRQAALHALSQSEEQLADIDLSRYEDIVFIGKSIGTKAALAFREKHIPTARAVLLTPLVITFEHDTKNCVAFHGTSDQWAETSAVERLCKEKGVPLHKYERANHSLETNDVFTDIGYLEDVLKKTDSFL